MLRASTPDRRVARRARRGRNLPLLAGSALRGADDLIEDLGAALQTVEAPASPGGVAVHGLVADGRVTRATRDGLYLYVNGRFVRDRLVQSAVLEACQGVVPRGRFPVAVLVIDLPPDAVDVNVHPSKTEVRFVRPQEVYRAVADAVRDAVRGVQSEVFVAVPAAPPAAGEPPGRPPVPIRPWDAVTGGLIDAAPPGAAPSSGADPRPPPPFPDDAGSPFGPPPARRAPPPAPAHPAPVRVLPRPTAPSGPREAPEAPEPRFLAWLGQDYALFESAGALVVLDAAAARVRGALRRMQALHRGGTGEGRRLLVPEVVDLPQAHVQSIGRRGDLLAGLGLDVEPFGPDCVAVKTVPPGVPPSAAGQLAAQAGRVLAEAPDEVDPSRLADDLASRFARHAAPGPGSPLDRPAACDLLAPLLPEDLAAGDGPLRPVAARFDRAAIDRWFKPA